MVLQYRQCSPSFNMPVSTTIQGGLTWEQVVSSHRVSWDSKTKSAVPNVIVGFSTVHLSALMDHRAKREAPVTFIKARQTVQAWWPQWKMRTKTGWRIANGESQCGWNGQTLTLDPQTLPPSPILLTVHKMSNITSKYLSREIKWMTNCSVLLAEFNKAKIAT